MHVMAHSFIELLKPFHFNKAVIYEGGDTKVLYSKNFDK